MRRQHAEATSGHQHPLDPKGGCGPGRPVPIGTQETLVNPFIRAGVIAGALMPLAVLTACIGPGTAAEPSSTTPTASSEVAVEPTARPVDLTDALNEARNTCSAADDSGFERERGYYTGITIADEGASIIIDSWGTENIHSGAAGVVYPGNGQTVCVVELLGAPAALLERMRGTDALTGEMTGDWTTPDGTPVTAYWTYHPDEGLDVIIEATPQASP